jgi:hypothetical protein
MPKIEIHKKPDACYFEDSKQAKIVEVDGPRTSFVRIQSWDEDKKHDILRWLDKDVPVKITIEW